MQNPLFSPYGGIRIFESEAVGDAWQDWSQVRSPSRALRRLKRGFKQRIVTRYKANGKAIQDKINTVIYMHPDDAVKFRAMVAAQGIPLRENAAGG